MDALLDQIQNVVLSVINIQQLFRLAAVVLAAFRYDTFTDEAHPIDAIQLLPEYDFVIVGAGSAGSVLANRLTENAKWRVLLLEAGGDEDEISEIPALWAFQIGESHDWGYKAQPSPPGGYCLGNNGQRCNWPRGKALGGGSAINAMVYLRGNKRNYDEWERAGNPGWSYEEVLPYFLKSEGNSNAEYASTRYHSKDGPLSVQESPWRTQLAEAFLKSGQELGYAVQDLNGANQTGFMYTQGTIRNGQRCSTSKAFLRPIRTRSNLHVSKRSHVTKVLVDDQTKRAYGVAFAKNGLKHRVRATKEVILAAGSMESPHLLMLSGIGPAEHLRDFNIPVLKDLRVGDNLQEHIGYAVIFIIDDPITYKSSRYGTFRHMVQYVRSHRGPLATLNAECVAFVNTKYANPSEDWPDIQYHFAAAAANSGGDVLAKILNMKPEVYDGLFRAIEKNETWEVTPTLVKPYSRGTLRLASADPYRHPLINPNFWADRRDMDTMIEGIKEAVKLGATETMRKYNTRLHRAPVPGCEGHEFATDAYWECAVRVLPNTFAHGAGTCKMGPESDPAAVVDARLKVHGIKGLRVIDNSIMPTIVTGNTNSVAIMIGEKGADMIKEDWK